MGSLKEIKTRIQSVRSTQKITSAMKMVSSAKLRKAENTIVNFYPYQDRLTNLLTNFLSEEDDISSVLATPRELNKVALVVFSSNSSLCGSFNANVTKRMNQKIQEYHSLGKENILIFPVGKKIASACKKLEFPLQGDFQKMADKPAYELVVELADRLMQLFINSEIDQVELIYHHFKNRSSQVLTDEIYLPIQLNKHQQGAAKANYLVEPDQQTLVEQLIPKVVRLKLYTALLDSNASEHAARTMAMQIATDNATDLLQELSLQYNKSRQQAITNELLDIMGGSFK
jgi:F-type H+-transporting ATPase subunit gamma